MLSQAPLHPKYAVTRLLVALPASRLAVYIASKVLKRPLGLDRRM
jgi:hypothetical protein